jgi:hypothetical protein
MQKFHMKWLILGSEPFDWFLTIFDRRLSDCELIPLRSEVIELADDSNECKDVNSDQEKDLSIHQLQFGLVLDWGLLQHYQDCQPCHGHNLIEDNTEEVQSTIVRTVNDQKDQVS